jgi:hypothetical protein
MPSNYMQFNLVDLDNVQLTPVPTYPSDLYVLSERNQKTIQSPIVRSGLFARHNNCDDNGNHRHQDDTNNHSP